MGGTSMNGASGGAGSARVRHACEGVIGMGGCWWLRAGVGTLLGPGTAGALTCEGWGCCFWCPCLVKLACVVGGWGVGCCLRTA